MHRRHEGPRKKDVALRQESQAKMRRCLLQLIREPQMRDEVSRAREILKTMQQSFVAGGYLEPYYPVYVPPRDLKNRLMFLLLPSEKQAFLEEKEDLRISVTSTVIRMLAFLHDNLDEPSVRLPHASEANNPEWLNNIQFAFNTILGALAAWTSRVEKRRELVIGDERCALSSDEAIILSRILRLTYTTVHARAHQALQQERAHFPR